ncbi:MAG: hypothetical protein LBU70_10840 [Chitinispirillales bacterium]|nr:hypothetical protein [Chitinispirillales bacterium]
MKKNGEKGQPVVRLRSMLIGLGVLVVSIAGPLALVWKQSYINQASIRLEYRADTLAALNREITALNLERTRLESTPRIERVARTRGFEYPAPGQIVVVEVKTPRRRDEGWTAGFLSRVRQSLSGKSG